MKKTATLVIAVAALLLGWQQFDQGDGTSLLSKLPNFSPLSEQADSSALASAIAEQRSGVQVTGEGAVIKTLPDDTKGSRHQRFLLRVATGTSVLVAHNIDLAPRIANLSRGDTVEFGGVFEWNDKGGVIHWTHHDPAGRHTPGWLKHNGKKYE